MVSVTRFINMDFEFFEKLSKKDADTFLRRFLEAESSNIKGTLKRCAADGIKTDFSIKSLSPFIRWILKRMGTIRLEPDPKVPQWIRNTDSYAKHLFEFNVRSKKLVLQTAYYLGESFVRSHSSLRWGTGDIKTMEANMPVVAGFRYELEMAPILVTLNLLERVIAEPEKMGDIEIMINIWNKDA